LSKFRAGEKLRQYQYKISSPSISTEAKFDGLYKKSNRPFCLPLENAAENLAPSIRDEAIAFFREHKIKWHDGQSGAPSNHLCDSQVCCVNFLFPFSKNPKALRKLLRPVFPEIQEMLPVESGNYVSFEWIGEKNYLAERVSRNGYRTRGANFTSADAIVSFTRKDNKKQVVLIEWKYTEFYSPVPLMIAKSGTSRVNIYQHLYDQAECPLKIELIPSFESLFYEPFYQFMRQQFLAHEMEKAHELSADIVSILHIAPRHNIEFRRITSDSLKHLESSSTGVWSVLVKDQRFKSVYTESLFGGFHELGDIRLTETIEYLRERYSPLFSE
jgi:hypothetical protein